MRKAQSAMEYLMTYGWSILIVAIVLGVLFQLGIFSSASFAPRAQPGNCHVLRTQTQGSSLIGTCNGVLPLFVAVTQKGSPYEYVYVPTITSATTSAAFTVSVWEYFTSFSYPISGGLPIAGTNTLLNSGKNGWYLQVYPRANPPYAQYTASNGVTWSTLNLISQLQSGVWYNFILTFDGNEITGYVNGESAGSSSLIGPIAEDNLPISFIGYYLGAGWQPTSAFEGAMANVQLYNTSLSASEAKALYVEGIGGAPVLPGNIVGWWPLNGDAKDYSGNNNNGVPVHVNYTSAWIGNYSSA